MNIQDHIRIVPNFPIEGINFYDIATLLAHPDAWRETIELMKQKIEAHKPDMILGIEARGFLVAAPMAIACNLPFGMIRKKGKLPGDTLSYSYDLEYGSDTIELQPDLVPKGSKIALVDDLLATGGTMSAAEKLIENAGSEVVANLCIIELDGLHGRDKLSAPFDTLLKCPA